MTDNITITANGTNNIYSFRGEFVSDYTTARTVYSLTHTGETAHVGQSTSSSLYYITRAVPLFDLSSLTDYSITKAIYKFTGFADYSTTDFNIQARSYTGSALAENTASFIAYGSTSFGSINSSNYSSSPDGMTITFNASGLSYLNGKVGGDCVIMLVSEEDMNESVPTDSERIVFYSGKATTTANRPHLYLEYEKAGSAWTPKIMMIMKPLTDGFLEWIRKPLQQDLYLQI